MTKTKKTPVKKAVKKAAPAKKPAAKKAAPKKAATPKAAVKKTVAAKPAVKKAVAKKAAAPKVAAKTVKKTKPTLAEFISAALDKDKAVNIVSIDLRGKTSIADFMTIATGTSSRHIAALARHLKDNLKAEFGIHCRIEGDRVGDWVILDAGDAIVHLFREEIRQTYNLEKLWGADFSTVNYTLYHSS